VTITAFIARRLVQAVPLLFGLSLLVFALIQLAPGDPTVFFLPEHVRDPSQRERVIRALGLDQPPHVQYLRWLGATLQGDFGTAWNFSEPVSHLIAQRLWPTVELQVVSILFSLALAIPIGVVSATRRNSWADHSVSAISLFGLSLPDFWFALMLMLGLSLHLNWLPTVGAGTGQPVWQRAPYFVMPVIVLGLRTIPWYARFTRSSMLEVMAQDYVRTARAKGMGERRVVYYHTLRNALIPVVTIFGLSLSRLVGGSVIVESVFAWPGIGRLALDAVLRRDYPVILALTLLTGAFVTVSNLVIDVVYTLIDPRIRYA
jgi:peptide/nickel transport system permease protein